MDCSQIQYGGTCHVISVIKCVLNKMTSIIVAIVHYFPIKQHLGNGHKDNCRLCILKYMHCIVFLCRYWLCCQISDNTTSTTRTIFDDEARKLLKTSVSDLLESLQGNIDDVPKVI
jgi:hypothetical protein